MVLGLQKKNKAQLIILAGNAIQHLEITYKEINLELTNHRPEINPALASCSRAMPIRRKILTRKTLDGMPNRFSADFRSLTTHHLDVTGKTKRKAVIIDAADCQKLIDAMRSAFSSDLFGRKKIPDLRAPSDKSTRASAERRCIPLWKKKPPCSYISS